MGVKSYRSNHRKIFNHCSSISLVISNNSGKHDCYFGKLLSLMHLTHTNSLYYHLNSSEKKVKTCEISFLLNVAYYKSRLSSLEFPRFKHTPHTKKSGSIFNKQNFFLIYRTANTPHTRPRSAFTFEN